MPGGEGDDQVQFGEGDDVFDAETEGGGNDSVHGGGGNDSLGGGVGDDLLEGGEGDDLIEGGDGADTIDGGAGNDTLDGGLGSDSILGGDGDDSIWAGPDYASAPEYTLLEGEGQTVTGTQGNADFDHIAASDSGSLDSTVVMLDGGSPMTGYLVGNGSGGNEIHSHAFSQEVAGAELALVGIDPDETVVIWLDGVPVDLHQAVADGLVSFDPGTTGFVIDGTGAITATQAPVAEPLPAVLLIHVPFTSLSVENISADGSGGGSIYALAVDSNPPSIYLGEDDTVDGGAGNDYIQGGDGDDSLIGGTGDDTLDGGRGLKVVEGGEGNDQITGTGGDTVHGGAGEDTLFANDVASVAFNPADATEGTVTFNDGSVLSFTGMERLVIDGAEVDARDGVVDGTAGADVIGPGFTDAQGDQIDGSDGANDVVRAGDGNDLVLAGAGDDLVEGGAGDDTLVSGGAGGPGNDSLFGGTGNDRLVVENGAGYTTLDGGAGNDTLVLPSTGSSGVSFSGDGTGSFNIEGGAAGGIFTGIERVETGAGSDGINAGASSVGLEILSGAGADFVTGGSGGDLIDGGADGDEVFAGAGADTVLGGEGNDFLYGGAGNDLVSGGTGNDYMQGDEGNDSLTGGEGDDFLRGDAGNDIVRGEAGNDSTYGGAGNDHVYGGDGNDEVYGGFGEDTVYGGSGNDTITGSGGNDEVHGDDGDDLIRGADGSDTLYGGAGADTMLGEEDGDIFYGGAGDYVDGHESFILGEDNDTLHVQGVDHITWDELNPENGVVHFTDGGSLEFYNIEHVFVDGIEVGAPADGIVSGTGGDDVIDAGYTGDPDGDLVDGGDATQPGAGPDDDLIDAGDGDDVVHAGLGEDTIRAGNGADTVSGGAGDDRIDLGDGDGAQDLVLLQDGGGSDVVAHFEAPVANPDGSYAPGDLLDVSDLTDAGGDPVDTADVVVSDTVGDGSGDAVLTFPDGSSVTLEGVAVPATGLDAWLVALGIPAAPVVPDGVVSGTAAGELIDEAYLGDQQGDRVDHGDGPGGSDADLIQAGAGNDTVLAGLGDDTVKGEEGDDALFGGEGADALDGGAGNDLLDGGAGADTLLGGDGRDTVQGGIGDVVDGGEGGDDVDTLDLSRYTSGPVSVHFDPVNRENGTVDFFDTEGALVGTLTFSNIENVVLPCFTPGARIATALGDVRVEQLRPGSRVLTRDHGYQEVRWIGSRSLNAAELALAPQFLPVRITKGSLGLNLPDRDLLVSPQHRMMLAGSRAELMFGDNEVLVAAAHLLGRRGIARESCDQVTYIHILFDRHEIVRANGCWTESFQPGALTLDGMDRGPRDEILALFPELRLGQLFPAARLSLRRHEVQALLTG